MPMKLSAAVRRFTKDIDQVARAPFYPTMPPHVFHYTRRDGLEKILATRKLRATHFRRPQGDADELTHMDSRIIDAVKELRRTAVGRTSGASQVLGAFLERYDRDKVASFPMFQTYIGCFSTDPEGARMWHDFADRGHGYCFGLKLTQERARKVPGVSVALLPVVYDLASQQDLFARTARRVLHRLNNSTCARNPEAQRQALATLDSLAATINSTTKPAERYAHEREWRLVVLLDPPVYGQPWSAAEVPEHYYHPLRRNEADLCALHEVYIGRHCPVGAEDDTRSFLRGLGYDLDALTIIRSSVEPKKI